MEMIANKESLAGASLIAPAFLQSNPVRTTNRKQPEKNQVNPVDTDFSERLSEALDQSGKRLEPAVKAADKRLLNKADSNKAASQELEQPQTIVSTDLIPVVTKSDDQAVTNGMNALGELKNAALHGLSAIAAPMLPIITQAVVPAVVDSSAITAVANGVSAAVNGLLNPESSIAQVSKQAKHAVLPESSMNPSTNGILPLQELKVTEVPSTPVMAEVITGGKTTDSGLVAMNGDPSSPDIAAPPQQREQGTAKSGVQPAFSMNLQHDMMERQIRQDLRNATMTTTTVASAPTPAGVPNLNIDPVLVAKQDPPDNDVIDPQPTAVESTNEIIVKPSAGQELDKRFMSESDKESVAGLSEKSEGSLAVPVGFDRVIASVNQTVVIPSHAAQPRPDLHEVVKQVMEGMVSPSQQLKSSQVIVTLKPEHLGEVTVKINVDGDKVTAAFHAASTEVRGILESSMSQLKQEMSQQGWSFDSDGVFGGMQEFLGQQQQQQAEQRLRGMTNHARPEEYDDALAFSSKGTLQVMSATAVDYRI